MNQTMFYTAPGLSWDEGLPLGNGRLAGMLWGAAGAERLSLNHEWLYTGQFKNRAILPPPPGALEEVRRLIRQGDLEQATKLANDAFAPTGGISGIPHRVDPFQPAGDLVFQEEGEARDYKRSLSLADALAQVSYTCGEKKVKRQVLASHADDVIAVLLEAENGTLQTKIHLERPEDPRCICFYQANPAEKTLQLYGEFHAGGRFFVRVQIYTDGKIAKDGNGLVLSGTDKALVLVNIGTASQGNEPAAEARLPEKADFTTFLAGHLQIWREKFSKLTLEIDAPETEKTVEERLVDFAAGKDPGLGVLYFHFARYLLFSASGDLPAQLQGIWNDKLHPPWDCDFHLDVNLQMNYWMAEVANMSETVESLLAFAERLVPSGREAARQTYGCRGILFPLQTDAWSVSTVESHGWGVWTGVAPWLAQHFWWRFEYGGDLEFLRNRAYPFLKECALFYQDYLQADEDGIFQISPSQSPENPLEGYGSYPVTLCRSATVDRNLCAFIFQTAAKAAWLLNIDEAEALLWEEMASRLPPLRIGSQGQLLEFEKEYAERDPGHRHMSHLLAVYPFEDISEFGPEDIWQAAKTALSLRLSQGGGHTGWSRAWVSALFARLGESEAAWTHLQALICDFATSTLLDLHPPRIFQIDGNLGGGAAVCQMLLQSRNERIFLLPALPAAWPKGEVSGLRAKGGISVSLSWEKGKLEAATLTALREGTFYLDEKCLEDLPVSAKHTKGNGCLEISLTAGETCRIG